jgi:hypothetical protein
MAAPVDILHYMRPDAAAFKRSDIHAGFSRAQENDFFFRFL